MTRHACVVHPMRMMGMAVEALLCAGAAEQQSAGGLGDSAHAQYAAAPSPGRAAAQQGGPPQHPPQVCPLAPCLLLFTICFLDQA